MISKTDLANLIEESASRASIGYKKNFSLDYLNAVDFTFIFNFNPSFRAKSILLQPILVVSHPVFGREKAKFDQRRSGGFASALYKTISVSKDTLVIAHYPSAPKGVIYNKNEIEKRVERSIYLFNEDIKKFYCKIKTLYDLLNLIQETNVWINTPAGQAFGEFVRTTSDRSTDNS